MSRNNLFDKERSVLVASIGEWMWKYKEIEERAEKAEAALAEMRRMVAAMGHHDTCGAPMMACNCGHTNLMAALARHATRCQRSLRWIRRRGCAFWKATEGK